MNFQSNLALFVPVQRKETENTRHSEKREGCHSGEFHSNYPPNVLRVKQLLLQTFLSASCLIPVLFFGCFLDYSVCDEHFNTSSPASQSREPVQNRIHQKHSTTF